MMNQLKNFQTTDTNNLVKKADYDIKFVEFKKKTLHHNHDKYITTEEFNKLMTENFTAR